MNSRVIHSKRLWDSPQNLVLFSLLAHVLAAIFSTGFHHYDEHFCILEFASFKLGWTPESALNVDYVEKMRPWLPPLVLYLLAKPLTLWGRPNPFFLAFGYRLISGLVGWWVTLLLWRRAEHEMNAPLARRIFLITACTLWFLPYIQAHPSAESLSGSFFFWGAALLPLTGSGAARPALWIGALWGLAFQFRYQSGVMIAGIGAWMLWQYRHDLLTVVRVLLGLFAIQILATLVDYWGYGSFALAPWNYLRWQLLEGGVNSYGIDPWWYFIAKIFLEGCPPLALFLFAGFGITIFCFPRHWIVWTSLPMIAVHTLIGHKELRFLFPLALAAPYFLALPLEQARVRLFFAKPILIKIAWAIWMLNLVYLAIASLRPARNEIALYSEIYNEVRGPLYFSGYHPYALAGVASHFYRSPVVEVVEKKDLPFPVERFWYVDTEPGHLITLPARCTMVKSTVPLWLRRHEILQKLRIRVWDLYACEKEQSP